MAFNIQKFRAKGLCCSGQKVIFNRIELNGRGKLKHEITFQLYDKLLTHLLCCICCALLQCRTYIFVGLSLNRNRKQIPILPTNQQQISAWNCEQRDS